MRNFSQKKKVRSLMYSPITFALMAIVIISIGKGTWNLYFKNVEAKTGRTNVEKEMRDVKEREAFLQAQIAALSTTAGVEENLRQKFNIKKEGEEVAVIVKTNETSDGSQIEGKNTWLHHFITRIVDFFQ